LAGIAPCLFAASLSQSLREIRPDGADARERLASTRIDQAGRDSVYFLFAFLLKRAIIMTVHIIVNSQVQGWIFLYYSVRSDAEGKMRLFACAVRHVLCAKSGSHQLGRPRRALRMAIEALEHRRLLSAVAGSPTSGANTFTVDTVAPIVMLASPANGSSTSNAGPIFSGTSGTASGDGGLITVYLFSGPTTAGVPIQVLPASTTDAGTYDVYASALAPGTYTAEATQSDSAGNVGVSNPTTFTVTPAATSAALAGSAAVAASSYNLTPLTGADDWTHWGTNRVASAFDDKATGGGQISNVTRIGSGSYGAYSDASRDVIWSDGSPLATDSGDQSYIWANNAAGAGYSFTAPADSTTRTLYVYLGGYDSGGTLTAHLSDSSAPDYTVSFSGNAIYNEIVAITYRAGSANQKLLINYTKAANVGAIGGSVDLISAWLVQPQNQSSPVIATNPNAQSVTAGTDVTFSAAAAPGSTLNPNPPTVQWYVSNNVGGSFSPIPGQTATTLDIGPATIGESGYQYEAIFANSAGTATTAPATLTVTSAPAVSGSLVGSSSTAAASYNYTTVGKTDWIHWGRASNAGNVDRKATGGSQISNITRLGNGNYGAYADPSRNSIWTDGSPTAKDTGDTGYIWANNADGAGFSFTAPADTTTRTLYIYLGGYDSGGILTATLSDNSANQYVATFSGASHYAQLVAITYQAGSAGQKLTLNYDKAADVGVLGGSVDLIGAWLG
jgi:hypothetical protein